MTKVLVVGSANADLVVEVERRPLGGETLHGSALRRTAGGKGANQATALGMLDVPTVFVGAVGDDDNGQLLRDSLAGAGVDLTWLFVVPVPTSTALITVTPDGENSIIVTEGANSQVTPEAIANHPEIWDDVVTVVMQLEVPLATVSSMAHECSRRGIRFVLNLAPAAPVPAEVLRACDPLVVNESEAFLLLGRTVPINQVVAELLALGPRSVVVTLGADGAIAGSAAGLRCQQPAQRVEVVDTTGAGDAFVAGLVSQLAFGGSLAEGLVRGIAAASVAVQSSGAAASYGRLRQERSVFATDDLPK